MEMGMRNLPKPAGAVGHGPFAHHPLQVACAVVVAVSVQVDELIIHIF